ncbi:PREDICTED: uncharacterized protein LOC109221807, partial [Nicotiana attenuata]|uniref:uncharacterized protein LOC109221807 n=1 Tax=Nicotiana attenuata TaxID=49451 RepID=UPI0009057692
MAPKRLRGILAYCVSFSFTFHRDQHPGVQELMMTNIRNLQAFALYIQKTDVKFDLFSVTKEMEKRVQNIDEFAILAFNFVREAEAMARIRHFLCQNNKKSRVGLPCVIRDMVSRYAQVALLDYGQVKDLPDELRLGYAKLVLAIADTDPLRASESYWFYNLPETEENLCGVCYLIMVAVGDEMAEIGEISYCPLFGTLGSSGDHLENNISLGIPGERYHILHRLLTIQPELVADFSLEIETLSKCENEQKEVLRLAQTMFDIKLSPGVTMRQPFAEEFSIKKIAVK